MEIYDPKLKFKIPEGVFEGKGLEHSYKYLKDVKDLYKKGIEKYDPKTIVYEVFSYTEGDLNAEGNLYWGLTVMYSVFVNGECNMTRGHYHVNHNCVEYYFGISGMGLLLLMDKSGKMWAEKVMPGSLHYISGNYAHRLVNTSDTILRVGACWPTISGHDYSSVEKNEFPFRVYKSSGKIEFVER